MTNKTRNGRNTVEVPLSNHTAPVKIFKQSLDVLEHMGVSLKWFINTDGGGRYYVKAQHRDKAVPVARLITGAGPRERVSFLNGNRLDLRLDNLKVTKDKTKKRKEQQ